LRWQNSEIDTFNTAVDYTVIEKSGYQVITHTCETDADFELEEFLIYSGRPHGGSYSLFSGQSINRRATATLKERLNAIPGDTLTFWTWYDIETDWDYAYVEASIDGQGWFTLDGNCSTDYNPNNHNEGHGITGNSGGWLLAKYDISDYIGQEINIRFRYWTDGSVQGEGIYIDDIFPYETFQSSNELTESVAEDSLLIGPYVSGRYYFQVAARDDRGDLSELSPRFAINISEEVYSISGVVELMDNPANLDGSVIEIIGSGMVNTTNMTGDYSISNVPAGIYSIAATHDGYFSAIRNGFHVVSDTILNFLLEPAPMDAPTLMSPIDGAVFDTFHVSFNWQEANSWYWWRVKAGTDQFWTEHSEVWSLLIDCDTSYVQFIAGDANGDGEVIGSDVTYLIGYFRSTNPPPDPFLAGDSNGDCQVTGPDVSYLVNYFRGSGDPPFQGDCPVVINYKAGSAEDF